MPLIIAIERRNFHSFKYESPGRSCTGIELRHRARNPRTQSTSCRTAMNRHQQPSRQHQAATRRAGGSSRSAHQIPTAIWAAPTSRVNEGRFAIKPISVRKGSGPMRHASASRSGDTSASNPSPTRTAAVRCFIFNAILPAPFRARLYEERIGSLGSRCLCCIGCNTVPPETTRGQAEACPLAQVLCRLRRLVTEPRSSVAHCGPGSW